MAPIIIKPKQLQVKILQNLHDRLKKQFSRDEEIGKYNCLRGYKGPKEFTEFGLDFWLKGDWVGIDLWGPPIDGSADTKNILGFATYSPNSRIGLTAAALARDARGIALYHDGRVFTRDGRARPRRIDPMTEINGRAYHKIAYIKDGQFFDRVMKYHFSRLNPDLSAGKTATKAKVTGSGMDAGPAKGGMRSSATFTALHNPITVALYEHVKQLGYSRRTCDGVSPDLLVEKSGRSVLFEVKPSASTHDLILACGQVFVYNEHAKADRTVIISAKADFSGYGEGIARVMKRFNIGFVTYKKTDEGYTFENLKHVLTA
jgi:hypothetical protein